MTIRPHRRDYAVVSFSETLVEKKTSMHESHIGYDYLIILALILNDSKQKPLPSFHKVR